MSEIRSAEERIAELDKKMEQIKRRKRQSYREKKKYSEKARTRRLIEVGGAVESVLGHPIEKEDIPNLIAFLEQQEKRGNYFSKAMKKIDSF
jgi:hypothetical protein